MRIALDAMGGDNAPYVNIDGAWETIRCSPGTEIILVGDEETLQRHLHVKGRKGRDALRISIVHASEVIPMDAPPSHAIRRLKDCSLRRAVELVRDGRADAAVTAGNSGAMMAVARYLLGAAQGVERPAIATIMPSLDHSFLLLDAGANVDCTAHNLLHFALMADAYCRHILGQPQPRIGLLSIGEEPSKGNELTKEAFKLLQKADINFIGNIESKDAFMGQADAVICDGFVGNVFLKTSEGLAEVVMKMLRREIMQSFSGMAGYLLMRPALRKFRKHIDYDEYGGAPLLGINGSCIISHGRSTPKAIKNAVAIAADFAAKKVHEAVASEIRESSAQEKAVVAG